MHNTYLVMQYNSSSLLLDIQYNMLYVASKEETRTIANFPNFSDALLLMSVDQ